MVQFDAVVICGNNRWFPTLQLKNMKVLIVDDHPLFRAALVHLIETMDPGSTVVQTGTAEAGLKIVAGGLGDDAFDIVLLDLNLPAMSGLTAVEAFVKAAHKTPVVVVSANERAADAERVLALGARGYLLKSHPLAELTKALRLVLSGGTHQLDWLEPTPNPIPAIADAAVAEILASMRRDNIDPITDLRGRLSERQFAVLLLLCKGWANREIGEELKITEATVKAHLSFVFRALGVITRTQAIVAAREFGLAVEE